MHVCLICVEIFAWGKYGGFGKATRIIGRELVKRGVQVSAVVPRRGGQLAIENLDGMRVYSFSNSEILSSIDIYRSIDADIYHSQEPSLGTYLARIAAPRRKHLVTFRDTRNWQDWITELKLPSVNRIQVILNYLYEDNYLVGKAVREADGRYAASKLLIPKARSKYRLEEGPEFLPTPVEVPEKLEKSATPTVCFVSRWDRRKRPEKYFELARQFPEVQFVAIGTSRDKKWDQYLRNKYGDIDNLQMTGFIDQFESDAHSEVLGKSWVMVNTSAREGLPNSFIEACAHKCALLSAVDPDEFASNFGLWVKDDDFGKGLRELLTNERWMKQAHHGYEYVLHNFEINKAMDSHLATYHQFSK